MSVGRPRTGQRRVPRSMLPAAHAAHVKALFIMQVLPTKAILMKTMPNADVLFAETEGGEEEIAALLKSGRMPRTMVYASQLHARSRPYHRAWPSSHFPRRSPSTPTRPATCTWEVSRPTLLLSQWSSTSHPLCLTLLLRQLISTLRLCL